MNPVLVGGRALNISAIDNAQDLDLVREVAKYFRVEKKSKDIISVQACRRVEARICGPLPSAGFYFLGKSLSTARSTTSLAVAGSDVVPETS